MPGRVGKDLGLSLEDLGIFDAGSTLADDPNILCFLQEMDTTSCGENCDKIEILSPSEVTDAVSEKCPPLMDTFEEKEEQEEDNYDPGFYRQLIEDESQNKKFAKIRQSVNLAVRCAAKEAADQIEKYIKTDWQFKPQKERHDHLVSVLENMGKMVFELTEKGEVEFLAKTWERRGGTSYEDEEDEKKISLLTLNLGGEENAIFVKKTRAITKKYMYRAMKQALEQLVKDFDLNESDDMLI